MSFELCSTLTLALSHMSLLWCVRVRASRNLSKPGFHATSVTVLSQPDWLPPDDHRADHVEGDDGGKRLRCDRGERLRRSAGSDGGVGGGVVEQAEGPFINDIMLDGGGGLPNA